MSLKKKIHVFFSTTPCSCIGHEAFETKNSLYNLNSYMIYYLAYTNNNILYNQYSFLNFIIQISFVDQSVFRNMTFIYCYIFN